MALKLRDVLGAAAQVGGGFLGGTGGAALFAGGRALAGEKTDPSQLLAFFVPGMSGRQKAARGAFGEAGELADSLAKRNESGDFEGFEDELRRRRARMNQRFQDIMGSVGGGAGFDFQFVE